jgi:multicomponent K+:H+ antiporter subunit G
MNTVLPVYAEIAVAALLLASGGLVLTAALGLWRMPGFFQRMHAPALAYTLASWSVTLASIVYFSMREDRLSLHLWVIPILLSITAPVTTLLLARAALFRLRQAGEAVPPHLRGNGV